MFVMNKKKSSRAASAGREGTSPLVSGALLVGYFVALRLAHVGYVMLSAGKTQE
jgi:hypothetical protein